MRNRIVLLNIDKLKAHEAVDKKRLIDLLAKIKNDRYLKNPVVVEDKHFIIIDGHHRVAALKKIGAKKIPSYLINYQNKNIRVFLRRSNLIVKNIKEAVIKLGLSNNTFPYKTTRHYIKNRPRNIKIKLNKLFQ